jgi:hypothetical protein
MGGAGVDRPSPLTVRDLNLTEHGISSGPRRPLSAGNPAMRSGQPFRSAAISSMTAVRSSMAARSTGWPLDLASEEIAQSRRR